MPLNPEALRNAFVATPDPNGSTPFGPRGIALVVKQLNTPVFIKFPAVAGLTYTVSTNVIPGDLVVTGPNGGPLNPGGAIKTFSFTPNQNGLYVVGFVGNPRFVVTGQEIDVSISAFKSGVPTTITDALHIPNDPVGTALQIAGGGNQVQYFLHAPDGNPNGLALAEPDPSSALPFALPSEDAGATPVSTSDGKPLSWGASTNGPTHITISLAQSNYSSDSGNGFPPFSNPIPTQFIPLVAAAAHVWEIAANVKFDGITDTPDTVGAADIRVGLADLSPKTMQFIGKTHTHWDTTTNHYLPDNLVTIEDPTETPVTALDDGDYQYDGFTTTVLQDLIHEFGHALGLAHNPDDPTSVMNPVIGKSNPLPDNQDIAAIQSLYGKPVGNPLASISSTELATLDKLVGVPMTS